MWRSRARLGLCAIMVALAGAAAARASGSTTQPGAGTWGVSAAMVPASSPAGYAFAAAEQSGAEGSLQALAASPLVSVTPAGVTPTTPGGGTGTTPGGGGGATTTPGGGRGTATAPGGKVKTAHSAIDWAPIVLLVIGLVLAAGTAGRLAFRGLRQRLTGTPAAAPGSTELVDLIRHRVTTAQQPSVTVLVDGRQVATIQLQLTVDFDISALVAGIKGGLLVAVHSGSCEVTATLAVQETDVLTASTHYDLPGTLPVSSGIQLLPAEEYPAGDRSGQPAAVLRRRVTPPCYSERMS